MRVLRIDERSPFRQLIGVGGIGSGIFFELEGNHTLGRNESRPGRLLDVRDYCKLHIVIHYVAKLLGARASGSPFHVLPVGRVGNDAPGRQMIKEMSLAGMDTSEVRTTETLPTLFSVCFQYPDGTGGNITTSTSAAAALSKADIDNVAGRLNLGGSRSIALAVPEVSLEVRHYFLKLATEAGSFRAASFVPAEIRPAKQAGVFGVLDLVALNEEEAGELVDCPFSQEAPETLIGRCQEFLRACCRHLKMVVSVGRGGAYGVTIDGWSHFPAPGVEVASTAGAGDSLLGGIIAATAAGIPFLKSRSAVGARDGLIDSALEFGVLLASLKCRSPHTIHPKANIDSLSVFARNSGYGFSPGIEQLFVEDNAD